MIVFCDSWWAAAQAAGAGSLRLRLSRPCRIPAGSSQVTTAGSAVARLGAATPTYYPEPDAAANVQVVYEYSY
jgi:hypothetical protein